MANIEAILLQADMEIQRTPQELCDWVDEEISELSGTDEGNRYGRSGKLLPKKLWEEIRPLGLFARWLYGFRIGIKCTPNLINDNYQGIIIMIKWDALLRFN
jgi:hypothetical protein